jgi:Response regulator containing a CheY-like receiver domain and an HTH DNA-binding domain
VVNNRLLKTIVVEDDEKLRAGFASTLAMDDGIKTVEAGTLAEAIKLCQKERQVVLLVDLGLPDSKGIETVERLKKELPGATLVVITGEAGVEKEAMNAGASAVIAKGSKESHGPALVAAVRQAVVRHDIELQFRPGFDAIKEIEGRLKEVTISSGSGVHEI